jgi:putative membrane protein
MKKLSFFLFAAVIIFSQACNNGSSGDSVDKAKDANDKKDSSVVAKDSSDTAKAVTTMPVDKDAADFAVEAANGGMMEVEMGNYAQQNAENSRIKDFGTMMVKDHTKLNDELKSIALAKNITLPAGTADNTKKEMSGLMKKTGKDFDKAYMNMMLDDHKKDVKAFEKTAKDCKDPGIKSFAEKALPVLLRHLDSCKAITGKN